MEDTVHQSIDRVVLACIQCRRRHVKCDADQPVCSRCRRDGKECVYQKSRRGGLDKAALARRRERLQQQAAGPTHQDTQPEDRRFLDPSGNNRVNVIDPGALHHTGLVPDATIDERMNTTSSQVAFSVNTERLVDIYYELCWPSCPVALPQHYLNQRRISEDHGMEDLLVVLQYIGSIFAPWACSEQYYDLAQKALSSTVLPRTPWSCQALMLFGTAQFHTGRAHDGRRTLGMATSIAMEIGMNTKEFAVVFGEGEAVLEESWRRTWYFLVLTDQHFSVIANNPVYALMNVPSLVDLPCDDEYYESGNIPTPATWQQYDMREFYDVEVVFSSIAYMADVARITAYIMRSFANTKTFNAESVAAIDAKVAVWQSLLPLVKRDPVRQDGSVDEVMFLAHLMATILMMASHRPFSSLAYSLEETTTTSFSPAVPFMNGPKQSRPMHTARTLKACDTQTRLLAIPCVMERHSILTACIVASIATAQVAACRMLNEHALSIARDRVRLSIGYLNAMGTYWMTSTAMAKEVRFVARSALMGYSHAANLPSDPSVEIELPNHNTRWPIDPSAQIDIYAGMTIPVHFDIQKTGNESSSASVT